MPCVNPEKIFIITPNDQFPIHAHTFNHPSSWRHQQCDHDDQLSLSAVHGHGVPSSDEDHGERGSS